MSDKVETVYDIALVDKVDKLKPPKPVDFEAGVSKLMPDIVSWFHKQLNGADVDYTVTWNSGGTSKGMRKIFHLINKDHYYRSIMVVWEYDKVKDPEPVTMRIYNDGGNQLYATANLPDDMTTWDNDDLKNIDGMMDRIAEYICQKH